ncbi:hypothetical protein T03_7292 [Trichinella britovi]|uniref:Uncharacterized protein n=1 Tax=Trichinella britovi TaxID=45882 RepID=A0A0V1CEP3_TRIBR|nr:hypothetical protein T03_7292 [Trichinella britovi]
MPLSIILRFSRHITYVGKGDFNTKGKCTILHEKHTGHAVSAQAYKEFLEKSKRFGSRQNPANDTRRFSAPLPSTALTSCHTLEALLNPNDSPLSDKENDPATVESAAEDSVVIEDGVEKNEEKVELSSSPRTDEERFQIIHAVLQGLCDNLLESEDAELDEKLAQLSALHSQWREMNLYHSKIFFYEEIVPYCFQNTDHFDV